MKITTILIIKRILLSLNYYHIHHEEITVIIKITITFIFKRTLLYYHIYHQENRTIINITITFIIKRKLLS
jgi:hypothetical protein